MTMNSMTLKKTNIILVENPWVMPTPAAYTRFKKSILSLKGKLRTKFARQRKLVKRFRFRKLTGIKTSLYGLNIRPLKTKKQKIKYKKLRQFTSKILKNVVQKQKSQTNRSKVRFLKSALTRRIMNKKKRLTFSKRWRLMPILNPNQLELRLNFWDNFSQLVRQQDHDRQRKDKNISKILEGQLYLNLLEEYRLTNKNWRLYRKWEYKLLSLKTDLQLLPLALKSSWDFCFPLYHGDNPEEIERREKLYSELVEDAKDYFLQYMHPQSDFWSRRWPGQQKSLHESIYKPYILSLNERVTMWYDRIELVDRRAQLKRTIELECNSLEKRMSKLYIKLMGEMPAICKKVIETARKDVKLLLKNTVKRYEKERKKLLEKKLNNQILLDFVLTAKLEMGERIYKTNKNEVIKSQFMGIRNEHAVYNINLLLLGLRLTLGVMWHRMKHKKRTLVNFSNPRPHGDSILGFRATYDFIKKYFLVTWKKWIGGILTNFKRLSKRIISRMKNAKQSELLFNTKLAKKNADYLISFGGNIPKLPAFTILTTNCHWALNESKHMHIPSTQLIEISHLGYFGDINLAMNTHYFGLRSFVELLKEYIVDVMERAKSLRASKLDLFITAKDLANSNNIHRAKRIFSKFAPLCKVNSLIEKPKRASIPKFLKTVFTKKKRKWVSATAISFSQRWRNSEKFRDVHYSRLWNRYHRARLAPIDDNLYDESERQTIKENPEFKKDLEKPYANDKYEEYYWATARYQADHGKPYEFQDIYHPWYAIREWQHKKYVLEDNERTRNNPYLGPVSPYITQKREWLIERHDEMRKYWLIDDNDPILQKFIRNQNMSTLKQLEKRVKAHRLAERKKDLAKTIIL